MNLDAVNNTIRAEIAQLEASKDRLVVAVEALRLWNQKQRHYVQSLKDRLERGDDSVRSYIDWTREQFSELPEHLVRGGGNAPVTSGKW